MKYQNIGQPKVQQAPKETIRYIEAPQQVILSEPEPVQQRRKGKREQCEPAKDFEQYIRRIIADTRQRIDDNDLSLSDHYIIESKAILLDEFCQFLSDCGLDHDGLSYGDHLCITHSLLKLRRELSGLKRTLQAFRTLASDLPEREKQRKTREAEQIRREELHKQKEKERIEHEAVRQRKQEERQKRKDAERQRQEHERERQEDNETLEELIANIHNPKPTTARQTRS